TTDRRLPEPGCLVGLLCPPDFVPRARQVHSALSLYRQVHAPADVCHIGPRPLDDRGARTRRWKTVERVRTSPVVPRGCRRAAGTCPGHGGLLFHRRPLRPGHPDRPLGAWTKVPSRSPRSQPAHARSYLRRLVKSTRLSTSLRGLGTGTGEAGV